MPTYEFSCKECGGILFVTKTIQPVTCPLGHSQIQRKYGFAGFHRKWEGGYSPTIGRYASSERDVSEGLKAASEHASESTGMEHRYVAVDHRELATTDE